MFLRLSFLNEDLLGNDWFFGFSLYPPPPNMAGKHLVIQAWDPFIYQNTFSYEWNVWLSRILNFTGSHFEIRPHSLSSPPLKHKILNRSVSSKLCKMCTFCKLNFVKGWYRCIICHNIVFFLILHLLRPLDHLMIFSWVMFSSKSLLTTKQRNTYQDTLSYKTYGYPEFWVSLKPYYKQTLSLMEL